MTKTVDPEVPKCRDFFARPNDKPSGQAPPRAPRLSWLEIEPDLAVGRGASSRGTARNSSGCCWLARSACCQLNQDPPQRGGGEPALQSDAIRRPVTAEPQFDQHAPFRVCVEAAGASSGIFSVRNSARTPFMDFKCTDHLAQLAGGQRTASFSSGPPREFTTSSAVPSWPTRKEFSGAAAVICTQACPSARPANDASR